MEEKIKKPRKPRKKRLEVNPVQTSNWKYEIYEIIGNNARFSFVDKFDDLASAELYLLGRFGDSEMDRKFEIKLVFVCNGWPESLT